MVISMGGQVTDSVLQLMNRSTSGTSSETSTSAAGAPTGERSSALGVIVGETDVTVALVERGAVLAVQTRGRVAAEGLDRWESALTATEQMVRMVEMAHSGAPPGSARVVVNDPDRQAARSLSGRLGVPVSLVLPGAEANLVVEGELTDPAEYAAAIGLALEALQESAAGERARRGPGAARLNFLEASRPPRPKRALSRRHAAAGAAAAAAIALALLGGYALTRRSDLNELRGRYAALEGTARQDRQARQRWRAVSAWMSEHDSGRRVRHQEVFDAVATLFPSEEAYVQNVVIGPSETGQGTTVRLVGRTRQSRPLSEFVSKLNGSPLFAHASLGRVGDDAEQSQFPKRFSVTFSLRDGR